jgi:hypothetical protein
MKNTSITLKAPAIPLTLAEQRDHFLKYSEKPFSGTYQNLWNRSVAAEEDVKGLTWLSRVKFND